MALPLMVGRLLMTGEFVIAEMNDRMMLIYRVIGFPSVKCMPKDI